MIEITGSNILISQHPAMYVWHRYWSRKTWNVVQDFITPYSREGDVVFDPFAGTSRFTVAHFPSTLSTRTF